MVLQVLLKYQLYGLVLYLIPSLHLRLQSLKLAYALVKNIHPLTIKQNQIQNIWFLKHPFILPQA